VAGETDIFNKLGRQPRWPKGKKLPIIVGYPL